MADIADTSPPSAPRYRSRVGLTILLVALALGPLAWIAQLLIVYAVSSHACYPAGAPLLRGAQVGFWWVMALINVIGIILAAVAGIASLRNYRIAQAAQAANDAELNRRIEARSEFLAGWGGLAGLGFFAAAIFDLIALVAVPPCLG